MWYMIIPIERDGWGGISTHIERIMLDSKYAGFNQYHLINIKTISNTMQLNTTYATKTDNNIVDKR